jgi:hypothetical protein
MKKDLEIGQGQVIGLSGSSGYSTGPHAHVQRQTECESDTFSCQSLELKFEKFGILKTGAKFTSNNCP